MGCKKETKITECTFSYAPWAACDNGTQTRMGIANPSGCSGTPPSDSLKKNCPTTITDLDGNSYGIKLIGNQTRTTKNLNVSKYRTGDLWRSIVQCQPKQGIWVFCALPEGLISRKILVCGNIF